MDLKDKEVLVIGLGISGLSSIKLLDKLGARISLVDSKSKEDLKDTLNKLKHIKIKKFLGGEEASLEGIDLILKSPGVPPGLSLISKAIDLEIEVITDIELAYRLSKTDNLIAITGTNGKTTATTLLGEIFCKGNYRTHVVGNIGVGILDQILDSSREDVFIIEASSFQLEHTRYFKPKVSLVLNISPDHIDWHGSFENYVKAKKKVFVNQAKGDYIVLNYDDKLLRSFENEIQGKIIYFSLKSKLEKGIYIDGKDIIIADGINKSKVSSVDNIKMLGRHNLENILGSIGVCYAMGISKEIIKAVIESFPGVEHRLEFVRDIKGLSFYNDSKGTNSDASIQGIQAIDAPILLIAGGYDKGIEFDDFIKSFNHKVKTLILLGKTKYKIKKAALRNDFEEIHLVKDMEEAVALSYKLGSKGDSVLLSPACASWDMYKNFEERGRIFKSLVWNLEEE